MGRLSGPELIIEIREMKGKRSLESFGSSGSGDRWSQGVFPLPRGRVDFSVLFRLAPEDEEGGMLPSIVYIHVEGICDESEVGSSAGNRIHWSQAQGRGPES